jgi:hypothetical protein
VFLIICEMYRSSGAATRMGMLFPIHAIGSIVFLWVVALFSAEKCVSLFLGLFWLPAFANVAMFVLFFAWHRRDYHRIAVRLIDDGELSVLRPDTSGRFIVFVARGQRTVPVWIPLPQLIRSLALLFPFVLPLSANPTVSNMCSLAIVPMILMAPLACAFLVAVAWLLLWGGEAFALADQLVKRTLERDSG